MNKALFQRDTFVNVFPWYGVVPDNLNSTEQKDKFTYDDFNFVEQKKTVDMDKTFYSKLDEIKIFTEDLLKTANMRGRK